MTHSILWKNVGQNLLYTGNLAFFSKISDFNNLLGVTEMIL